MQPHKLPEFIAIADKDADLQASRSCMRLEENGLYHREAGCWSAAPWWDINGRLRIMEMYARPATAREWANSECIDYPIPLVGHYTEVMRDLEQKYGFMPDASTVTDCDIDREGRLPRIHKDHRNLAPRGFDAFHKSWEPVAVTITIIAWRHRETNEPEE